MKLKGAASGPAAARNGWMIERLAEEPPPTGLARDLATILERVGLSRARTTAPPTEHPTRVDRLAGRSCTTLRLAESN